MRMSFISRESILQFIVRAYRSYRRHNILNWLIICVLLGAELGTLTGPDKTLAATHFNRAIKHQIPNKSRARNHPAERYFLRDEMRYKADLLEIPEDNSALPKYRLVRTLDTVLIDVSSNGNGKSPQFAGLIENTWYGIKVYDGFKRWPSGTPTSVTNEAQLQKNYCNENAFEGRFGNQWDLLNPSRIPPGNHWTDIPTWTAYLEFVGPYEHHPVVYFQATGDISSICLRVWDFYFPDNTGDLFATLYEAEYNPSGFSDGKQIPYEATYN